MDLEVITIKGYSAFPKAPALLEPDHQIVLCHIQNTCWGSFTPLQRCSRCILPPQPTRPYFTFVYLIGFLLIRWLLLVVFVHLFGNFQQSVGFSAAPEILANHLVPNRSASPWERYICQLDCFVWLCPPTEQ